MWMDEWTIQIFRGLQQSDEEKENTNRSKIQTQYEHKQK